MDPGRPARPTIFARVLWPGGPCEENRGASGFASLCYRRDCTFKGGGHALRSWRPSSLAGKRPGTTVVLAITSLYDRPGEGMPRLWPCADLVRGCVHPHAFLRPELHDPLARVPSEMSRQREPKVAKKGRNHYAHLVPAAWRAASIIRHEPQRFCQLLPLPTFCPAGPANSQRSDKCNGQIDMKSH